MVRNIKPVRRHLPLDQDALAPQRPAGRDGVDANGRPPLPWSRLNLQLPGIPHRIVVDDGDGHDLLMDYGLTDAVQARTGPDVYTGEIIQVQHLGGPIGKLASRGLPAAVGLVGFYAIGQRRGIGQQRVGH